MQTPALTETNQDSLASANGTLKNLFTKYFEVTCGPGTALHPDWERNCFTSIMMDVQWLREAGCHGDDLEEAILDAAITARMEQAKDTTIPRSSFHKEAMRLYIRILKEIEKGTAETSFADVMEHRRVMSEMTTVRDAYLTQFTKPDVGYYDPLGRESE